LIRLREGSRRTEEDIKEELVNLDVDPTEREKRYYKLFMKYFREAGELKKNDYVQAAEKLWGAVTALIKAYFSRRGVFVAHWSRSKIYNAVDNNIEKRYRQKFYDLLTYGGELHEHFYEKSLTKRKIRTTMGTVYQVNRKN